jgi:hypothetical protein
MGFCHEISMKTPLVLARAMLLVLLIFSSPIETGALARPLNGMTGFDNLINYKKKKE